MRTIDAEGDMITFAIEAGPFLDGSRYLRIDEHTGDIFLKESLHGQVGVLVGDCYLEHLAGTDRSRSGLAERKIWCGSAPAVWP